MIDITPEQRSLVSDILVRILGEGIQLFVFGSRAKGCARPYSDLDLLIRAPYPISLEQLALAAEDLADSDLPFKVDLVADHQLSHEFRQRIEPDLVPLRRSESSGSK